MEQIAEARIDLFADQLPSLEELEKLSLQVHSSERTEADLAAAVEENINKTGKKAVIAVGIGLYELGRYKKSIKKLEKSEDCAQKFAYLAKTQCRLGEYEQAAANYGLAIKNGGDKLAMTLGKSAALRMAGELDKAAKELKACANFENVSCDYHYELGRLCEAEGDYKKAKDSYKAALEIDPEHQKSLFRLAFRCDLEGDEEAAIDYYKQVVANSPVYISALMNLAVIYEDQGKYDNAERCIIKILEYHPNNKRAILFKKDIESSKTMYFDEEKEKKKDKRAQILDTPISDFELSVRSRNCLKKMNIHTLGDLLNITEPELLSYKNFGETSLREIKVILEAKGLRLGQSLEEGQELSSKPTAFESEEEEEDAGVLNKSIDELQLSVRARKCIQTLGLRTLGDLTRRTEAELLGCKNFGVTSLNEIKKALSSFGVRLRTLD